MFCSDTSLTDVQLYPVINPEALGMLSNEFLPSLCDRVGLSNLYQDRFPYCLPVSAFPYLFRPEVFEKFVENINIFSNQAGISDLKWEFHLIWDTIQLPDDSLATIPVHTLTIFEYEGLRHGGPFLGSALGNSLQVYGQDVDPDYRYSITRKSLENLFSSLNLSTITMAVPLRRTLEWQKEIPELSAEKRALWLDESSFIKICSGFPVLGPLQYVTDHQGIPLTFEQRTQVQNQIFMTIAPQNSDTSILDKLFLDQKFKKILYMIRNAWLLQDTPMKNDKCFQIYREQFHSIFERKVIELLFK